MYKRHYSWNKGYFFADANEVDEEISNKAEKKEAEMNSDAVIFLGMNRDSILFFGFLIFVVLLFGTIGFIAAWRERHWK
jgi:hypothetical protein